MSAPFVLGVDGGGTKTECALAPAGNPDTELARVRGERSNHETIGYPRAAETVHGLVTELLDKAGTSTAEIAGACFAMAGMDLPPDREHIREHIVTPLGLSCPVRICNDAFAGFRGGSPRGVGLCVSLGTGITFCGSNGRGADAQFEQPKPEKLPLRILRALYAEYQGVGPACGFRNAYLEALGIASLEELLYARYAGNRPYAKGIPDHRHKRAAQVLFDPAFHEEPVLCGILRGYGAEIAAILVGLARKLGLGQQEFDLVLSGSVLTKGRHPALNGTIVETVRAAFAGCAPVLVDAPPVRGALRIAAELAADGA